MENVQTPKRSDTIRQFLNLSQKMEDRLEGFQNMKKVITNSSYTPPHPTAFWIISTIALERNWKAIWLSFSLTFDHWKAKTGVNLLVAMIRFLKEDKKSLAIYLLDAFAFSEHEEQKILQL